jgi:FkbM family methyltransferase
MEYKVKKKIIDTILRREKLRHVSKIKRLILSPLRTIPYYGIAAVAKIRPFVLSFKTLWGDTITCDLPNGNTFLYYGNAEANLTNFLIKNIAPDEVFLDGGANIGFYSLLAARLATNGQVHSFEPTPSTFTLLQKNLDGLSGVTLNNVALLDKETEIDFTDYGIGYNAFNSIHLRDSDIKELEGKDRKIRVPATTLDTYCKKHGIAPTFIKLDLEGSEYFAILGAKKTLESHRPTLSLEVAGDKEWSEYIQKTDTLLKELSYESFSIATDGQLERHDLQKSYAYDNLIYIHSQNTNKYIS